MSVYVSFQGCGNRFCFLYILSFKSAYEVTYSCCLFERLFRVTKNDVFLFEISFFVTEIFTILCYANKESDDVIEGSSKAVQHSITQSRISLEILKQSNLAPETNITKERK